MSLLNKFETVQVEADKRITEADKTFCLRQQEAFDKSGVVLQQIAVMMESAVAEQENILGLDENRCSPYLTGGQFSCDADSVYDLIKKRNETFIDVIAGYFVSAYNVELNRRAIKKNLLPAEPEQPEISWNRRMDGKEIEAIKTEMKSYDEAKKAWELSLRNLPLRYEQILDEIFVQLGGFTFEERAMNELVGKCWKAVHLKDWRDNTIKDEFEVKNDTIKFNDGCSYDKSWGRNWSIRDNFKIVLDALAHYICGRYGEGRMWFPDLFQYSVKGDGVFPSYHSHVKQIKLFKNRRIDIKFRSATEAMEFADTYLRRKVEIGD